MEQLPPNSTKIATKWALIYLVTGIVITYAIQYLVPDPTSPARFVIYVPFVIFLFLAQKEYKDALGGYIKFGDAFSTGLRFGVFAGLLFGIFIYIYLAFLNPDMLPQTADAQRAALVEKGLSPEQIDKAKDMTVKYGAIFGAFGTAIWYAILGVIFGLIGAAIFKKERSAYDVVDTPSDPVV